MEGSIQEVQASYTKNTIDLMKQFFKVNKSNRSQENHLGHGAMGLMSEWDGQVNYDTFEKGHENNYRHIKYSTGLQVERELIDFQEFNEIENRINEKTYGVTKTLNFHASRPFENAFSTFLAADGLSMCNASHTTIPGADAQSNTGTDAMTVDTIEDAMILGREYKDDRGHVMNYEHKLIVCGEYWRKTAQQIVGSEQEPFNANNEVNVYKNMEKLAYFCTPWITGKKWFMVDIGALKRGKGLNWYMARDPRSNWEYVKDFDTEVGKYKTAGMWSYGIDNPLCVIGNTGG